MILLWGTENLGKASIRPGDHITLRCSHRGCGTRTWTAWMRGYTNTYRANRTAYVICCNKRHKNLGILSIQIRRDVRSSTRNSLFPIPIRSRITFVSTQFSHICTFFTYQYKEDHVYSKTFIMRTPFGLRKIDLNNGTVSLSS